MLQMFRIKWFAFCFVLLSGQTVVAQIVVSAYKIDDVFTTAGTGKYDAIIEKAQLDTDLITIKYQSIINARRSFKTKETDCLAPSDQSVEKFSFPVIQSNPFNIAKAYVFWRTGEEPKPTLSDLESLVVGYQKGMNFDHEFEVLNIRGLESRSLKSLHKALLDNKIHAFVAYTPDIWLLFNNKSIPGVQYDISMPFLTHKDSIFCHQTARAEAALMKFNRQLQLLDKAEVLHDILGIAYTPE